MSPSDGIFICKQGYFDDIVGLYIYICSVPVRMSVYKVEDYFNGIREFYTCEFISAKYFKGSLVLYELCRYYMCYYGIPKSSVIFKINYTILRSLCNSVDPMDRLLLY